MEGTADDEVASLCNHADFTELEIHLHRLVDVSDMSTATSVLGQDLAGPPVGAGIVGRKSA